MADSPPATAEQTPASPAALKAPEYMLKWEPIGEFSEEALFTKGTVRAKVWISDKTAVHYRSLGGEEVYKINEGIKVAEGMSVSHFRTEQTYWNLAFSVETIGDKAFEGTFAEKLARVRVMAAPILSRLSFGYLEFSGHVDDLFVGKKGDDVAKKS